MSSRKNGLGGVGVAVVNLAAFRASPFSYSQLLQPARAAARMARRTGYGKKRFAHFFELHSVRDRYIAELVSEERPRCVVGTFRHLRCGADHAAHTNSGMPPCGGAPYLLGLKSEVSRSKI